MKMSNSVRQRRPPIRRDPEAYAHLRLKILKRDGWRCQNCGSTTNLDVHHMKRRSDLGDDAENNLIALCRRCHRLMHGHSRESRGVRDLSSHARSSDPADSPGSVADSEGVIGSENLPGNQRDPSPSTAWSPFKVLTDATHETTRPRHLSANATPSPHRNGRNGKAVLFAPIWRLSAPTIPRLVRQNFDDLLKALPPSIQLGVSRLRFTGHQSVSFPYRWNDADIVEDLVGQSTIFRVLQTSPKSTDRVRSQVEVVTTEACYVQLNVFASHNAGDRRTIALLGTRDFADAFPGDETAHDPCGLWGRNRRERLFGWFWLVLAGCG